MSFCITLENDQQIVYQESVTPFEILKNTNNRLLDDVFVAKVNDDLWDLNRGIDFDAKIKFLTWKDDEGKSVFWHSSAHLLAAVIKNLYPNAKLGKGPSLQDGFYYDVDLGDLESKLDIKKIELKTLEFARKKNNFIRSEVSKQEAIDFFSKQGNNYKLDILNQLDLETVSFYRQGEFTDLCLGPHIANTGVIQAFRITNISGAHWQGDITKKQMTRIYGISFPSNRDLEYYEKSKQEAENRNHKKIGKDLKLFMFSDKVGIGLPIWLPKGAIIRQKLIDVIYKEQLNSGYLPVITPHIGNKNLYVISGHYQKYGEDSFNSIKTPNDGEEYILKPMNCPHHCEIYKNEMRSYKDLPLRFFEFGTVYRYEQHGELNGLARARCLTQDDAHIFCTEDQLKEEFSSIIDNIVRILDLFDFKEYLVSLSLRDSKNPNKYIGDAIVWENAEETIRQVVRNKNLRSIEMEGEAAFYGPKLDFLVKDSLGRKWQLGTIQLDYQLPRRFGLEYIGADGKKSIPCMIHRAQLGTIERFIALLLEHTGGRLPLWLSAEQVSILTVSNKFDDYANQLKIDLSKNGLIVSTDLRKEKLGKKILDAELKKIPYIVTVGQKELDNFAVSIRKYGQEGILSMFAADFIAFVNRELICKF